MNLPVAHPRAPAHVIETLRWTSTGGDRAQALAHQARVSDYLRGPGRQLLDRVFTRLSPADEAWRLDTLEVDLGRLPMTASFAEWSVRLEQALWLRLHDARRAAQAPVHAGATPSLQSTGERELEHFLHYLQRGHLPWSVNPQAGRELAQWLSRLAQRFGLGLWTRLQRLHPAGDVLFRLGRIAPHHGLQALLAVRDPELAASLQLLGTQLLAPLHARGRLSAYQLQAIQQAWRVAGLHALWGRYAGGLSADRLRRLHEALAASLDRQLGHDWRRVLRQHRRKLPRHGSGNALRDKLLRHLLHPGRERRRPAAPPPAASASAWPTELHTLRDLLDAAEPPAADALAARIAALRAHHPRQLQAALRPLALQRAHRQQWHERWGLPALWPWLTALAAPVTAAQQPASHRTDAALDPAATEAPCLPAGAAWAESLRQFALHTLASGRLGRDAPGLSALQAWLADASVLELALGGRPPQDHAGWTRLWQRALRRWPGAVAGAHTNAPIHDTTEPPHGTGTPESADESADATTAATAGAPHIRRHANEGRHATVLNPPRHHADADAEANRHDDHGTTTAAGRPLAAPPSTHRRYTAGNGDHTSNEANDTKPDNTATSSTDVASTTFPHTPQHSRAPHDTPPPSERESAQDSTPHAPTARTDIRHPSPTPTAARTLNTPHAAVIAALACAREGAPPPDTATRLRLLDALADATTCTQWLRRSTPAQRWTLLERLLPREIAPLRAASRHLRHAHALTNPTKSKTERERQHWQFLARHLLREGLPAQPALLARRYALHLAATDAPPAPRPSALAHWQQRLHRALRTATSITSITSTTPPRRRTDRRRDRTLTAMQRALRTPPTRAERSELIDRAHRTQSATITAPRNAPAPAPAHPPEPSPLPATTTAAPTPTPDPELNHYLDNAGLVLLATYAPRLFERLDLLDGNRLRDPAAAARAVRCLAWLAYGHDQASEPECVLPKLLCGLEINAPLVPSAPLETDTCALLDGLLQSVIAHWSALGQTSLAGLRQTFLQREGRLMHLPESTVPHWHLAVSSGAFDMLLDRLPWSFATLKLPWMPEVLHVQWR